MKKNWTRIIAVIGLVFSVVTAMCAWHQSHISEKQDRARKIVAGWEEMQPTSDKAVPIPESELYELVHAWRQNYARPENMALLWCLTSIITLILFALITIVRNKSSNKVQEDTR